MNDIEQFKSHGKDKRIFRRFGVELAATVGNVQSEVNCNANKTYRAVIKDISLSGLSFISNHKFDVGTTVSLSMIIHQSSVTVVGIIRRSNNDRIVFDHYNMGLQYIKDAHTIAAIPIIGEYIQKHSLQVMKR